MTRGSSLLLCILVLIAFLSIASIPIANSQAADTISESTQVDVRLEGPQFIGIEQEVAYQLRISYSFPERIINYSYKAELVGANAVGAELFPNNGTSVFGLFSITIIAPPTVGDLVVKINASASEEQVIWNRIKEFEIEVVQPILISTTLHNHGEQDAYNVTVQLYIDSNLEDTKIYDVPAGESIQIEFNWTFISLKRGAHNVMIVADSPLDIIEFSEGNNVFETTIYYSKPGNLLRGVLSVLIIFISIILVLTILQKRTAPRG